MIYLRCVIKSDKDLYEATAKALEYDKENTSKSLGSVVNKTLSRKLKKEECRAFVSSMNEQEIELICGVNVEAIRKKDIDEFMKSVVSILWDEKEISEINEIGAKEFATKIDDICIDGNCSTSSRMLMRIFGLDYFDNNQFDVHEEIEEIKILSKEEIYGQAKEMISDKSLLEEIERIYDESNPEEFLGHPVHYRINCGMHASEEMAKILIKALYSKKRLCSKRVNKITEINEGCYDETDLEMAIKSAIGGTIIIDMSGKADEDNQYASVFQRVVEYFAKVIRKYSDQVLFIFVENSEKPGFSKNMISCVTDYIDLIDIRDGNGTREEAVNYFKKLHMKSSFAGYAMPNMRDVFPEDKSYSVSEIHRIFEQWRTSYLRKNIYQSYSKCKVVDVEKVSHGNSFLQLNELIGLDKIKLVVNQIIATSVIDQKRRLAGGAKYSTSKHMIFTGNPGSCKTTVARILASTLKEEGVLETGAFVECGRADLIGKYVGWTDKQVRAKFREAKGGVLFIDEAYSLVEEGGHYGDEAINTIVQEMENHREDVIVIFAGYPEKMRKFLEKNEGLRSRIAFHLEFPDYNADELEQIFQKMVKDKKYKVTTGAMKKARELFERAVHTPEFGNGRFARNVFEQAMMKQAFRLYHSYKGAIPEKELFMLRSADLELDGVIQNEKKKNPIGFSVAG